MQSASEEGSGTIKKGVMEPQTMHAGEHSELQFGIAQRLYYAFPTGTVHVLLRTCARSTIVLVIIINKYKMDVTKYIYISRHCFLPVCVYGSLYSYNQVHVATHASTSNNYNFKYIPEKHGWMASALHGTECEQCFGRLVFSRLLLRGDDPPSGFRLMCCRWHRTSFLNYLLRAKL